MTTKVAVLARDVGRARELASRLVSAGLSCMVAPYGVTTNGFLDEAADLVVVDLDGPRFTSDYETLLRHLKEERHLSVIVLVEESAVAAWEIAAEVDDFVVKPVRLDELVTRMYRILVRAQRPAGVTRIKSGDLTIDPDACHVLVRGEAVHLTFREYELLKFLVTNAGRVFTREELLNRVWGYDYYVGERTVDVHIRRLRSKIELTDETFIETVRGVGYRFKGSPEQGAEP